MKQIKNIRLTSQLCLECQMSNFEVDSSLHRLPVQLLKDWRNVIELSSTRHYPGQGILDSLEFEMFLPDTP